MLPDALPFPEGEGRELEFDGGFDSDMGRTNAARDVDGDGSYSARMWCADIDLCERSNA